MDIERLYGKAVSIAESDTDSDTLNAKFIICDFSVNGNNVRLNRDTIDSWVGTLVNKPFVGKVVTDRYGDKDFSSHCMHYVERVDENGERNVDVEFDTSAFGTFSSCNVETIDGVDCIVAECVIWKRYKQSCDVLLNRFDEGTLHTSWEIQVKDASFEVSEGNSVKVINDGAFIGHCALGKDVMPAYESSKLLEVASDSGDDDLVSALVEDSYKIFEASLDINVTEKEEMNLDQGKIETVEEPVADVAEELEADVNENAESTVEESSLTAGDIYKRLSDACYIATDGLGYIAFWFPTENSMWVKKYNSDELNYSTYTYTIDASGDVVLSEPQDASLTMNVSQINDFVSTSKAELDDANQKIENLNAEVAELTKYRDIYVQASRAKKVDEITSFAKDSGCFTDDELSGDEMKDIFSNVDYSKLNGMIADRLVAKKRKCGASVEKAEASTPIIMANLTGAVDKDDYLGAMKDWLRR